MKKLVAIILSLLLGFYSPATEASCGGRGFGATYGVSSTDVVAFSSVAGLGTKLSIFAAFMDHSNSTNGQIFNHSCCTANTQIYMQSNSTMHFQATFSTTNGNFQGAVPSLDVWHTIVVTYDGTSTSNLPIVYIDGSSVSMSALTTPVGTIVSSTQTLRLGNQSGSSAVWNGKIGDEAAWANKILTATEAKELAMGVSPLRIEPASLAFYTPMCGLQAAEPDYGPSHYTSTVTGTKATNGSANQPFPFQNNGVR